VSPPTVYSRQCVSANSHMPIRTYISANNISQMIKGMKGKSYEERLQKLKLWSLEERRNRQDLIEVFKICKGFSRIRPKKLFLFDDRGKGTTGHSLKLVKVRCTWDSRKHFF